VQATQAGQEDEEESVCAQALKALYERLFTWSRASRSERRIPINASQYPPRISLISQLPGLSIPIDLYLEGSLMADNLALPNNRRKSFVVHSVGIISQ
jgi:hypothetical protein